MSSKQKISIIGDIIIDENKFLKSIGTSLETPNLKGTLEKIDSRIGGAGNIISALNILGYKPYLYSFIGDDYNKFLYKNTKFLGFLKKSKSNSTIKTRYWSNNYKLFQVNQDLKVTDKEKKNLIKVSLEEIFKKKMSKLIISDYSNIFYSNEIIKYFYKIFFSYDYKKIDLYIDSQFSLTFRNANFNYSDFYILNLREYIEVCKYFEVNSKLNKKTLNFVMKKLNIQKKIIVKMGKEGSLSYDGNNIIKNKIQNNKLIRDVSGAGDYFLAAYVSSDTSEKKKIIFSNAFALKNIL